MPGIPSLPAVPAHWRFPAHLASVPQARRAVADALPVGCPRHLSYELRLLTSELVTNAIRHGALADEEEMVELVFWSGDGHYWLAVSDPGSGRPDLPSPTFPDLLSAGGRGLLLIDALSDTWGVATRAIRGKSVIAGIRVSKS
ncbi:ATP-binding protein [Kitasatospora sp. NPDC006697]|uniref:ATP-binding protein n=1 Tax=Kitasatospora sp. NPDC006697 TaxID=3364020 RepID=UPI0036CC889C